MNRRRPFEFTSSSWILLSGFLVIIALIIIVWQPLVQDYLNYFDPSIPWWMQVDWLLIGIFLFMSVLITLGADLRSDWLLVVVGFCGGFVIESWGTHAGLWAYYTGEKPPLWILPAWPIAALCIERMVRLLPQSWRAGETGNRSPIYWLTMAGFVTLMAAFIVRHGPSPLDWIAFSSVLLLVSLPGGRRTKLLIFAAGAALGLFLEYWGTSRECWVYYTHEVPPVFAVFAHGMASVAFWQVCQWIKWGLEKFKPFFSREKTSVQGL
jgi:hypothetical protein